MPSKQQTLDNEYVVLVIGSVSLDRLLTVSKYPLADSKVRTESYHEIGGGNAANTASAMGLLQNASFLKKRLRIKFLSKVGDDRIGTQLEKELQNSNVDTSSDLFRVGHEGSSTGFATIVVELEGHTRTCLYTAGSAGELSMKEVQSSDMEKLFNNVIHLHSDSRHTEAALILAQEAKKRGIPISVDCEKERRNSSFESLIQVADILFTSSNSLASYLQRRELVLEASEGRIHLPDAVTSAHQKGERMNKSHITELYTKSLAPITFFTRWYPQVEKQVIVTHGEMGALHYQILSTSMEALTTEEESYNKTRVEVKEEDDEIRIHHHYVDKIGGQLCLVKSEYRVHQTGVLKNLEIVDTTGAGDAFIGGYVMANLASSNEIEDRVQFALEFGSWVGGRKLEGPGARRALPTSLVVDETLGLDVGIVKNSLREMLSRFAS